LPQLEGGKKFINTVSVYPDSVSELNEIGLPGVPFPFEESTPEIIME
jgi:hypothetical protein